MNPLFKTVLEHTKTIVDALFALSKEKSFDLSKTGLSTETNDQELGCFHASRLDKATEIQVQTSGIMNNSNPATNLSVLTFTSSRTPFVTFYKQDLDSFVDFIVSPEFEAARARIGPQSNTTAKDKLLKSLLFERMYDMEKQMKLPVNPSLRKRNKKGGKQEKTATGVTSNVVDYEKEEVQRIRAKIKLFLEVRRAMEAILVYPMQEYMLSRLENRKMTHRLFHDKNVFHDKWVSRQHFVELVSRYNPVARKIVNNLVWKQGNYVPLLPLALKISGINSLEEFNSYQKQITQYAMKETKKKLEKSHKRGEQSLTVTNNQNSATPPVVPSPALADGKSIQPESMTKGLKVLCNLCCCKITYPDLSLSSELELLKPRHDLRRCPICSKLYLKKALPLVGNDLI